MPEEQLGDEDVSEEELEDVSNEEDESEYDKLPNFRPLKKAKLNELKPVPVPMPDMALPPSFNVENPSHRYRYLDSESNQWLVRPVLETHGWDHDIGYEGVNVEKMFVIGSKIPVSVSGQATKDKKEAVYRWSAQHL
ncbi:hypothetical protein KI387_040847 [Taxus chinensis]|uniref:Translocase of chloroplast 159/132 membrane anchor domain-containing protein n=1 Tax=Taxus chinensis TaxID=29808 RepID=A0AA38F960_TAXCH|nr:hypothetical protein KI387_040847 [Taxus chinensis]